MVENNQQYLKDLALAMKQMDVWWFLKGIICPSHERRSSLSRLQCFGFSTELLKTIDELFLCSGVSLAYLLLTFSRKRDSNVVDEKPMIVCGNNSVAIRMHQVALHFVEVHHDDPATIVISHGKAVASAKMHS